VTNPGQPEPEAGYELFFELNEAPFSLAPDPRFLFASASHSAALAQVAYAIERREPLVVITGEIGTGKTLLCRIVLQRLPFKTFLSVINDPLLEGDELLKQMLQDFGVISKDRSKLTHASRHDLVQTLHAFLTSLAPIQAHAVVIIDEAQHLQPDILEQIRLLSNIDDARGTVLQIMLVGQTDLEPLLSRPELRQLKQRMSRRLRLEALNRGEVEQYIEHRLALARDGKPPSQAAGATDPQALAGSAGTSPGVEFTPDAIDAVSQLSGGIPRVINLLCDRSLEEAYASLQRIIDSRIVHTAARTLGLGEPAAPTTPTDLNVTASHTQVEPERSVWTVRPSEPTTEDEIVRPADGATPGFSAHILQAARPHLGKYLALAAVAALVTVAIVFGIRTARPPVATQGPSSAPASSATRPSGARPDPAAAGINTSAPKAPATAGTPTPPQAAAPPPSTTAAPPSTTAAPPASATAAPPSTTAAPAPGERFDVVVASFRTDARATSVTAEVAALGLPTRRRVLDGWQQVICGPFASRMEAEKAQQRLDRAGLTGTQIAPTAQ
jgi:type II secretory pathway predicted ATPase ExeA